MVSCSPSVWQLIDLYSSFLAAYRTYQFKATPMHLPVAVHTFFS
uniref:Uncharacterized protein n=1 Tax=Arundo donax TaxID=35708 RepID=A0A0A8ZMJ8_ARUDO